MEQLLKMDHEAIKAFVAKANPEVLTKLQELCNILKQQVDHAPTIDHPFNMIISGPTGSGKTWWLACILEASMISPMPHHIHLFMGVKESSGELIKALEYLHNTCNIPYTAHRGLADLTTVIEEAGQQSDADEMKQRQLLILDDLQHGVVTSQEVSDIFTSGTHHLDLSCILVWQDLFPRGKNGIAQTLTNNAQYNIVFYSNKTRSFDIFASQRTTERDQLKALYKEMANNPEEKQPLVIANRHNRAWLGVDPTHIYRLSN